MQNEDETQRKTRTNLSASGGGQETDGLVLSSLGTEGPLVNILEHLIETELSEATALTGEALRRARERQFTETLLSTLDAEQVVFLKKNLAEKGLALSRGGRFHTVQSEQADKGKAVQWLTDVFRKNLRLEPLTAAVGDSPNDVPRLAAVDFPFLVQKPDGLWTKMEIPDLKKIEGIGPAGFSAAVRMLLGDK